MQYTIESIEQIKKEMTKKIVQTVLKTSNLKHKFDISGIF